MSLTVPRAGSIAGRSANLQVAPDQTGEVLRAFAGRMTQIGIGLEQDRLQREANRLQVDLARDMNNLQLDLQSIGDPDEIDRVWQERSAAIRSAYLDGTDDAGRPRVSAANRDQFGLNFDDLANRVAFSVGSRAVSLRQDQRMATYMLAREQAVIAAAAGDPSALATADAQYAQMVAAGIVSPVDQARETLALQREADNARAISMSQNDPEGLLAAIAAGELNSLGAEVMAQYGVSAQATIDRRAADAAEAQVRAQRDYVAGETAYFDEVVGIVGAVGDVPIDYTRLQAGVDQGLPGAARAMAAVDLAVLAPTYRQMAPASLRALIDEERRNPFSERWQTERLQLLEDAYDAAVAGWTGADPVAFAADVGMDVPAVVIDAADPAGMVAALEARRGFVSELVADRRMVAPHLLTEAERGVIAAQAGVDADPASRAALAQALTLGLPPTGIDSVTNVTGDPVFAHMGALLATGVPASLAEEVFRGQQAVAQGNVVVPTRQTVLQTVGPDLGAVFATTSGGEQEQAAVLAAANALYAARARIANPGRAEDAIDEDLYRQALHEVMGGIGPHDSADAMGGLRTFNGHPTVLPRGVTAAAVENAFSLLGSAPDVGFTADLIVPRLTAASVSGLPPTLTEDPAQLWEDLQDARLVAVGRDQYEIVWDTQTGPRALVTADGAPYRLDLRRLIAEVTP